MTQVIDNIFDTVSYWQDKKLLLQAIKPDHYFNKSVIIKLLGVTSGSISPTNEAKKDMWNHQLYAYNMGDDILKNIEPEIFDDIEFAKQIILKYPRSYIYLGKHLQSSRDLALLTARKETNRYSQNSPILKFMPQIFQEDHEISTEATFRNIENLAYAKKLQNNKYFILDLINRISEDSIKHRVLSFINKDFLDDKRFISKLGCFEGLCDKFKGDEIFISYTVMNDIEVLDRVKIFSAPILKAVFKSKDYQSDPEYVLVKTFKYIERFTDNYAELEEKIKDKKLLNRLFWEMAEILSDSHY